MAAASGRALAVNNSMFFIFIPFYMKKFNRNGGTGRLSKIVRKHGTSAPPASQWGRFSYNYRETGVLVGRW
jgi:hypothetical protein